MCEEKHEFTTELFEETFGANAADAYYIYYLDDNGVMHFFAEEFSETAGAFTTNFNDARMFDLIHAKFGLILGHALLDYELHTAHITTTVLWDC